MTYNRDVQREVASKNILSTPMGLFSVLAIGIGIFAIVYLIVKHREVPRPILIVSLVSLGLLTIATGLVFVPARVEVTTISSGGMDDPE